MKRGILRAAKRVYRGIGSSQLRRALFRAFQAVVARRRVVARVDGLVFDLDLGETIDLGLYLDQFEPEVVSAIETQFEPGWIVADIGANIGAHTLRIARTVGSTGRVLAFEPTDYAFTKLLRNVALNPFSNIVPLQLALDSADRGPIQTNFRASWRWNGGSRGSPTLVDAVRLDRWIADNAVVALDAIKLDVDGHEFAVLEGARESLSRFRPLILMEAGDYHFVHPGQNPFTLLSHLGYEISELAGGGVMSVEALGSRLAQLRTGGVDSINVLCRSGGT